jgi:hypothetical protein
MFRNRSTHQSSSRTIFLDIPRKWASRFVRAAVATLLIANCTFATTLVGTVVTTSVETIPEMNALIVAYNNDIPASLPLVTSLLDKLEDAADPNDGAIFEMGILDPNDFNFYVEDNSGTTVIDVFDALDKGYSPSTLGEDSFSTVDENVQAFEQLSGDSSTYYVSKNGNAGWSLWISMAGVNPVYTDKAGGGFTRGEISDDSLAFDPAPQGGVSHISFYNPVEIPEPGTLLLGALASLGMLLRRKH